jgi:transcriptional regulator with XRE-family HTH domain
VSRTRRPKRNFSKRIAAEMRALREAGGLTPEELAARVNENASTVLEASELASRRDKDAAWIRAIEDDSIPIYLTDIAEFAAGLGITPIEFIDGVKRRRRFKPATLIGRSFQVREIETIDGVSLARLYRLTIDAHDVMGHMRAAFIEADDEAQARHMVAQVVAVIAGLPIQIAASLVCNVRAANSLIEDGISEDRLHRLFEIRGASIHEHPMFLLSHPGTLTRKWAERITLPHT